jgi:hypothetical protein
MTIASVDEAGVPWVSPVFLSPDEQFNVYWVSDVDARHSESVRRVPTVAFVIYEGLDGELDAAYFTAEVEELQRPDAIAAGIEVIRRRPQQEKWDRRGPRGERRRPVADLQGDPHKHRGPSRGTKRLGRRSLCACPPTSRPADGGQPTRPSCAADAGRVAAGRDTCSGEGTQLRLAGVLRHTVGVPAVKRQPSVELEALGPTPRAASDSLLRQFQRRGWRDLDDAAWAMVEVLTRRGGHAARSSVLRAVPRDFLERNGIRRRDVERALDDALGRP